MLKQGVMVDSLLVYDALCVEEESHFSFGNVLLGRLAIAILLHIGFSNDAVPGEDGLHHLLVQPVVVLDLMTLRDRV